MAASSIDRATICGYYIKSLRTGEQSAAKQVGIVVVFGLLYLLLLRSR